MSADFSPAAFLDLSKTEHAGLFTGIPHAWEVLPKLKDYLKKELRPGHDGATLIGAPVIGPDVFIGEGTVIEPGAYIKGPAWIGAHCEIRHGAYIRENVIVGAGSVVGNSCEIKNSILFQGCQVAHFNYVGDSILGAKVHLAAGVIVSNLKLNGDLITVRADGKSLPTHLRKFGALIGDEVEIGCNTVLNPGTILGRRSLIYPGVVWRGLLPASSVAKSVSEIKPRHD